MQKVIFCIPTYTHPYSVTLESLEKAIPFIKEAGWQEGCVFETGNPYISNARSVLVSKALEADADVIVFIDHDVSFSPEDLLKLLETDAEVCGGTYRFKKNEVEYMGALFTDDNHLPIVREDGCLKAECVPAGFLKITRGAVEKFKDRFPSLVFQIKGVEHVDLFNHGAYQGVWYGEDYAFCRRWRAIGDVWMVPDLNITHHFDDQEFPGNFHEFLLRQPGGSHAEGN